MTERAYYRDGFLTRFSAVVTDIRLVSQENGQQFWQVALDRSAFYPTSGGQPHDTGCLLARAASGAVLSAPVISVEEDERGEVWHTTSKPLLAGTAVEGEVDWVRRFDHMQQHSGQHLLSACFLTELGAATVSFHLGSDASTIDVEIGGRELGEADLHRVLTRANNIVADDRAVRIHDVSEAEARAMLADGRLRKLPERGGDLRVIEMDGVEFNACGGTHVARTAQIGAIAIRGVEKVKAGLVRVTFVCGGRAMAAARRDFLLLQETSRLISAPVAEIPEAVRAVQELAKSGAKEKQKLLEEMAGLEAALLRSRATDRGGLRWVEAEIASRGDGYLRLVAARVVAEQAGIAALLFSGGETVQVAIASSDGAAHPCGEILRRELAARGLRGGGGATLAQCSVPAAEWAGLRESLRRAFAAS
jgi:alanyl-tRNA synthetase